MGLLALLVGDGLHHAGQARDVGVQHSGQTTDGGNEGAQNGGHQDLSAGQVGQGLDLLLAQAAALSYTDVAHRSNIRDRIEIFYRPERPNSLKAFLGRITRNISVTRLRRSGSQKRGGGEASLAIDELSECLPGGSDPARTAENRELLRSIDAFLSLLPKRERVIFLGRYFYALTAEEIAARLGMKTAAVKTSLYRTRKRLAQKLEEEGY